MARSNSGLSKMKWYYQLGLVAAVSGLLLALSWYYYMSPMQEQIVAKQQQLDTLSAQVAKALQQKQYFEKMKAESLQLEAKLLDLKKILPLEKETPEIVRAFYAEASGSGVRILRLNLRPVVDHDVYTEWPWDIEVIGTYNTLGTFLDKIRQLSRIVNVSGLKLGLRNAQGDKAFTESIGATYTATTFIYHPEPVEATAPPPKPAK